MSRDDDEGEQEDTRKVKNRSEKFKNRLSTGREQGQQVPQAEQGTQGGAEEEVAQGPQKEHGKQTEQTPVTDRRHATFYLSEDLHKRLDRGGKRVSLNYEMEFDAELGKNRYLRPLMLYLGLERLQEMDPEEIRDVLDETDILDDAPE